MSVSEKLTTIRNSFKNIKSAILEKGASVSGDVTTYADAIASIPVGSEVITGKVSGSGAKTLTITDAIGKDNIAVFLVNSSSANASASTVISIGSVGGSKYMTYKSSGNILGILEQSVSYNKNTGTISYTGSNNYVFYNVSNLKYMYVAW